MTVTKTEPAEATSDGADAYDIATFCARHAISRSTFYNLCSAGRGPRLLRLGARVLITVEAARAWRVRMERETAEAEGK